MRDTPLNMLTSEFRLWGVKFTSRTLSNCHVELRWQASPDKEFRTFVASSTPSDWRAHLNNRSAVRRIFRADGLSLKDQEKPKPILHKALELPSPVEKDSDQIRMLRAEIADLTELVLDLSGAVTVLRDHVVYQSIPTAPLPAPAEIIPQKKPSVRSIKTIDFVSEGWNTTDALAKAMGVETTIAYRKLYYLMKQEKLELSGGRWRKKQKPNLKLVEA